MHFGREKVFSVSSREYCPLLSKCHVLSNSINYKKERIHELESSFFRKNLYVWSLETSDLVKILDAHFARIIQLEALTVGNWNSVVTSSIDRSVKVWNINNIFEQVHVIDRHELQIDMLR